MESAAKDHAPGTDLTAAPSVNASPDQAQRGGRGHAIPDEDRAAIIKTVCEALARGEDLTAICESPELPSDRTIRNWAENQPEFGSAIAHARARGFDRIALNCRKIARGDTEAGATGDVARDRLIVDTDLKLLAKWDPKRYGDLLKLGGPNGEALAPPVVNQFIVQPVVARPLPGAGE